MQALAYIHNLASLKGSEHICEVYSTVCKSKKKKKKQTKGSTVIRKMIKMSKYITKVQHQSLKIVNFSTNWFVLEFKHFKKMIVQLKS